jgi:hypothetical protein
MPAIYREWVAAQHEKQTSMRVQARFAAAELVGGESRVHLQASVITTRTRNERGANEA